MMNVCTQAGLRRNEQRLFTPANIFPMVEDLDGEGERESGEEGGESGGAGNLEFDRALRDTRPDSRT